LAAWNADVNPGGPPHIRVEIDEHAKLAILTGLYVFVHEYGGM